jgi:hypothetical protein
MKLLSQKQACQQKHYDDTLYEIRTNENNIIVSSDESMDSSSDSDDASVLLHENLFHVKYRMSLESFNRLLQMLCPELQSKEKYSIMSGMHPITYEVMMHCTIHYLAEGSFHDICATASISKPSFYRLVWHTIHCINRCEALDINLPKPEELNYVREGFQRISKDGVMNGCIGALDGNLMRITAPSYAECSNVGAYFSGHYCTYGVNVQVMCNADCHFTFLSCCSWKN